jgi:hypothetical protein
MKVLAGGIAVIVNHESPDRPVEMSAAVPAAGLRENSR